MSAHQHGAPTGWSQRVLEQQRQDAIERQRIEKHQRQAFLEVLAERLAAETGLPFETALRHVRAVAVTAKPQREQHISLTFARFG
jgi:hypothetical protein